MSWTIVEIRNANIQRSTFINNKKDTTIYNMREGYQWNHLETETRPITPMLSGVGLYCSSRFLWIRMWWRRVEIFIRYYIIVFFGSTRCGVALQSIHETSSSMKKTNWAHLFSLSVRNINDRWRRPGSTKGIWVCCEDSGGGERGSGGGQCWCNSRLKQYELKNDCMSRGSHSHENLHLNATSLGVEAT